MKKIILLASIAVLSLSCTSDSDSDNNSNNNSNSQITPPSWIQGEWVMEDVPSAGYIFYTNDLCQTTYGNQSCMRNYINIYQGTNVVTNVVQQISETEYKCLITVSGFTNTFHFLRVSENKIKDVNMSNSSSYPKYLVRK